MAEYLESLREHAQEERNLHRIWGAWVMFGVIPSITGVIILVSSLGDKVQTGPGVASPAMLTAISLSLVVMGCTTTAGCMWLHRRIRA